MFRLFLPVFFASICLLFTSCSSEKKATAGVRINLSLEPTSLDPLHVRNQSSLFLARHLHEGLYRYFNEDVKEGLADFCEVSTDQKTYTIHLKEARYSNGSKITAHDFVESVKRALFDDKCDYAHLLFIIKNAKKIRDTKQDHLDLGVQALSDNCLVYTLEHPYPDFISLLTHPVFFPTKFDENKILFSGPYVLQEHIPQSKIKLKKNSHYIHSQAVNIEEIEGSILSNETALALYQEGELDYIGSPLGVIPHEALHSLSIKNQLFKSPWLGVCFLRVNTERLDPELRRSLSGAIDQHQIALKALGGHHLPLHSFLPSNFGVAYKKTSPHLDNHIKLTAFSQRPLTLKFSSSDIRMQNVACFLKNQIESTLGVVVHLVPKESKMLLQEQSTSDFDLIMGSWIADIHDPQNFLEIFYDKSLIVNGTKWQSQEFKDLLEVAKWQPEKRQMSFEKAQNLLLDDSPVIPLFQFNLIYAKDRSLEDFSLNSLGVLDFSFAKLKR